MPIERGGPSDCYNPDSIINSLPFNRTSFGDSTFRTSKTQLPSFTNLSINGDKSSSSRLIDQPRASSISRKKTTPISSITGEYFFKEDDRISQQGNT